MTTPPTPPSHGVPTGTPPDPPQPFDTEDLRRMRADEADWDARTPVHLASRFYGPAEGLDPARWFTPFEWADLGPLDGAATCWTSSAVSAPRPSPLRPVAPAPRDSTCPPA